MNILIVGDSWGVPNYILENFPTYRPEDHLEFHLKKLGHSVYNYSLNGNSNKRTMESVDFTKRHLGDDCNLVPHAYLPTWMNPVGHPESLPMKIDWTIWFHTEVFRDGFDAKKTFHQNLVEKSHEVYSYARTFFEKTNSKLAVIGGQAAIGPSVRDIFYSYIKPDFIIEDWRSEIVGKPLPECYTVSSLNGAFSWALQGIDRVEEKERLVDAQEVVIQAMEDCEDFADNAHPAGPPNEKLAHLLHEVFTRR